ncbi:MAG TPA: PqqD family protein [Perlabentimonas sp.]|nr:PqqD family protein [Bacteroidales bacterium]MDD4673256.1 PqqD family protein [Bacteroidales bacterium]MDY0348064.1 PqqD family protein [Tenuifilaceae bacterium]HZJ74478.1 PqqD family protein [Perlabentimonas sp.]
MSKIKKDKSLKSANALELVPEKLQAFEVTDSGLVTILVPRTRSRFMLRIMKRLNRSPNITIELDEIGSKLWLLIDGKLTTQEVCTKLQQGLDNKLEQAPERVVKYLSGLYYNKHITFKRIEEQ